MRATSAESNSGNSYPRYCWGKGSRTSNTHFCFDSWTGSLGFNVEGINSSSQTDIVTGVYKDNDKVKYRYRTMSKNSIPYANTNGHLDFLVPGNRKLIGTNSSGNIISLTPTTNSVPWVDGNGDIQWWHNTDSVVYYDGANNRMANKVFVTSLTDADNNIPTSKAVKTSVDAVSSKLNVNYVEIYSASPSTGSKSLKSGQSFSSYRWLIFEAVCSIDSVTSVFPTTVPTNYFKTCTTSRYLNVNGSTDDKLRIIRIAYTNDNTFNIAKVSGVSTLKIYGVQSI